MKDRLRIAGMTALAFLIGVPALYYMIYEEPSFAAAIMYVIAVIGFFTVVFVMIIGSEHDHYPKTADESAAVTAWQKRLATSEQANESSE